MKRHRRTQLVAAAGMTFALVSRASELCPVADSGSARSWPSELPGGGQVFCPGFSWPGA